MNTDQMLSFHRPKGMSCAHFRKLIKERVAFANRPHTHEYAGGGVSCKVCGHQRWR